MAKPANLLGKIGCMRWVIYIRCPAICSNASDTEATSTWRKASSRAALSLAGGFSGTTWAEASHLAPTMPRANTITEIAAKALEETLGKRDLFIESSWLYICARTLTLFFFGWKRMHLGSQNKMVFYRKGETMRKSVSNLLTITIATVVIIASAISAIGSSQARRAITIGE